MACAIARSGVESPAQALVRREGRTLYPPIDPIETLVAADKVKLLRDVAAGKPVTWEDVAFDAKSEAVRFRRQMEKQFAA